MIQEKVYGISEIETILKTKGKQATKRKLESWGVEFSITGTGKNLLFDVKNIPAEIKFKVFCITELEVAPQTDFDKLRIFYFYYFGDKYFRETTDAARADILLADGYQLTAQTISKYISHLEKINFVSMADYGYYSCSTGRLPEQISESDYEAAWKQYHIDKVNIGKEAAYRTMIQKIGGKPVKVKKRVNNAFEHDKIVELTDIISDDLERIYGKKQ